MIVSEPDPFHIMIIPTKTEDLGKYKISLRNCYGIDSIEFELKRAKGRPRGSKTHTREDSHKFFELTGKLPVLTTNPPPKDSQDSETSDWNTELTVLGTEQSGQNGRM